jgi:DNA-binding MarR family transcriptional regulator
MPRDDEPRFDSTMAHVADMPTQKIAAVSRALDRAAETAIASRADLTLIECRVLAHIEVHAPVAIGDLASGMFIDNGQTSRTVTSLVGRGYIRRVANPEDQRSNCLELSAKGRAQYERMRKSVAAWNERLMQGMSGAQRKALVKGLDHLLATIESTTRAKE